MKTELESLRDNAEDMLQEWLLTAKDLRNHSETLLALLPDFRTLRLWHWNMSRYHRNCGNGYEQRSGSRQLHHTQADFHIKQVQLLNVFFEVGDIAEADAAK